MTQSFRKLVSGLRNDGNSFRVATFPDFGIPATRLLPPGRLLGANVVRPSGPSAWPGFPRPGTDRRAGAVRHSPARRRGDTYPEAGGRGRSRLHPRLAVGDVVERRTGPDGQASRRGLGPLADRGPTGGDPPARRPQSGRPRVPSRAGAGNGLPRGGLLARHRRRAPPSRLPPSSLLTDQSRLWTSLVL